MAISFDEYKKIREQAAQDINAQPPASQQVGKNSVDPTHEYRAWRDWKGNVNLSDVTTGQTERYYQAYDHIGGANSNKGVGKDSFLSDLGQAIGGAAQGLGANYKSDGATLLLGAAGLLHGDNNYQPIVGSALWRMTEGAEADTGVANQLKEDSKYGRGALGRFAMDLTSGAVDLAGDQMLNLVAPGAGMAAMAARSFGGTAEEQREQGKSISTQFFKGLKSAAIEYGTEKFAGIGGRKIEGGGYIDNLLSRAEESIVRKGGNAFLTKLGFAFGSEAVEEMMSDWLNPLADKFLAGVVKGDYDIEDFPSFAEVAYDGLIGGALGLLGGAREGLQAQSRVRSMGGNQGYADFLAQERADTKAQVKNAKKAKRAQLKAIFDYATHHAEQAMDRAKNIKANEASQTPVEAQQPSTQQVTPEAAETPENAPSREFNSKPEAEEDLPFTMGEEKAPAAPTPEERAKAIDGLLALEDQIESDRVVTEGLIPDKTDVDRTMQPAEENSVVTEAPESATMEAEEAAPRQRGIGKKTGERLAGAALLADAAKQRAAREADSAERGVEVDASDFTDSEPAKAEEEADVEDSGESPEEIAKSPTAEAEPDAAKLPASNDTSSVTSAERVDSIKRSTLQKLKKDFTSTWAKFNHGKLNRDGKNVRRGNYAMPDIGDTDVPIKERLTSVQDYDNARFMDEVDDYVDWWMSHDEIVDGQHMTDAEKERLLPKKIERFVKQYEQSHNYQWQIEGNDIVKVYSTDVTWDAEKEAFESRYSDESLDENARQTRLKRALAYDLSTAEIADIIKPLIKPKLLTQHIDVRVDGIQASPYSLNVSYPQTTDRETGKKVPAANGKYTVEVYCNDAKTDTAVRLLKFKAGNEADAAKRAANIIKDFELGGLSGREALMKKTRKQIATELNKQFDARAKDGSDILANKAAPDYSGSYSVGDFTVTVSKAIKESRGRKFFDGWEVKVYMKINGVDHVVDLVKTRPESDANPLQIAATLVHDTNFDMGGFYRFSFFKHKPGTKFEQSWNVTAKNGKSVVKAPDGSIHETPVGASAIDDINTVIGEKANPAEDVDKEWFEELTDDDIIYSQQHPATVSLDGTDYEVRVDWTSGTKKAVEYIVTIKGEEDVEAHIGINKNRADWSEEDAVDFAIKHPKIWTTGYVEGEDWSGRSKNGTLGFREGRLHSDEVSGGNEGTSARDVQAPWEEAGRAALDGRGRKSDVLGRRNNESAQGRSSKSAPRWLIKQAEARVKKQYGQQAHIIPESGYDATQRKVVDTIQKRTLSRVFILDGADSKVRGWCDADGNIYIAASQASSLASGVGVGYHELVHSRLLARTGTYKKADAEAARIANRAFVGLNHLQLKGIYSMYADAYYEDYFKKPYNDATELMAAFYGDEGFRNFVQHEALAAYTAGSTVMYSETYPVDVDVVQEACRHELEKEALFDAEEFDEAPLASEVEAERGRADNSRGDGGVDEDFAKAAMPEDLDGLSERIKSSDNKFYGERKANITKAAEAISKNIGKDASTVLPEDLADFVGKDFSQASKDIDGFAKEFLTALATEDDGVALKTLADDLPKRIKKSKALKELLGDAETGNVAKMARVLAEAEDAKTAQNAASDLAEMIAKEAEEMPKRLKTLEQWDKNLSKRGVIARFLSGNKTVSQIASVYFGYQRDMINVLQGLDNFDKYGDGYGYKLAKKILDANFKSQTALGNSIDHVLTAQAEFEKSGGANKTVELKMLKKNQWESHKISLAEAVDFLHTIRTLQASKVNAWQDITYLVGDEKLTISSQENFNRIMDVLTKAVRSDKAANAYYQSFTDGYAMFKDVTKDAIRDASGRTVDMYEDGSYYPLLFAKKGEASAEHDFDFGLDSTKFTQRRVNELGGVISITDPAVRFNSYAHVAANLVARAATGAEVERLNRGGLGKSITSLVEERYGKGATDTVKQYIKDSSNFRQESDTASSLLRNLRLNIQGGALFGNFGSMLKQYPSVYNAAGVLDFDSITHGIISQMNAGNRKRAAELGSIKTRHQGNLDPSVAETLNENSGFKKAMEKLKILKFAKEGFEIVDSAAIRTIYLASEYQVEVKDNISRDSAEFNDRVMDYFIPAFLQTQPQFEKTLRPFVQTSDSELIRMFGMFKTQPLRNLNTMIRTISEYNTVKEKYGADSKEFKETEKQLRHTVAGQASASLMFGALGVLAKLLYHRRKDLEDKEGNLDAGKVMSRILMNAAEASGGMLVFGDAAVQMVIDMASGGKTNEFYGLSAGAVSSVADALDAVTTFAEKPNAYNAKRAAGYISTLLGIPLNNAYAILNSAIMYGKDISGSNEGNYDDILKYLDAQAKAAKKEEEKAAKAAAKEAEKSGADMLADTAKQNASQSDLNSQEEQKTTEVSTYLKKPYQALLDSGMSSEKSQDLLAFIDTDDNNSIKQAELVAFYKDNPNYEDYIIAMWNSYGWKTTWEKAKAKAK